MSLWLLVLLFAVPSLTLTLSIYVGVPLLQSIGVEQYPIFLICMGGPLALMFMASLVAYRLEGNAWSWIAFKTRFRLEPMDKRTWLWTLGLTVFALLSGRVFGFTDRWIRSIAPPPEFISSLFDIGPDSVLGVEPQGNWWLLVGVTMFVFFNVFGEELWWRGYILPRQEVRHGQRTWFIHGILWTLFHSFFYWQLIGLLPAGLFLSFVAQKCKSTWPGIIAHGAGGVLTIVLLTIWILSAPP